MPACIGRPLSYLNFAQTQLLSLGDQNGILSDVKGQSTRGKEEIPALKRDVNAANLSTAKQIRSRIYGAAKQRDNELKAGGISLSKRVLNC